ncbi:MAG: hypothetical protein EBZ40_01735 [Gammaproteobacteria bacterium]|nr:hypothetical protein [Gammaproteobacteria bacterium]
MHGESAWRGASGASSFGIASALRVSGASRPAGMTNGGRSTTLAGSTGLPQFALKRFIFLSVPQAARGASRATTRTARSGDIGSS